MSQSRFSSGTTGTSSQSFPKADVQSLICECLGGMMLNSSISTPSSSQLVFFQLTPSPPLW